MKLILSRKGFDSSSGGVPSPILPDGRLLSFPIPEDLPGSGIPYDSIRTIDGGAVATVMDDLHVRIPPRGAHLDPDLVASARPRAPGWRPCFGQDSSAQRHLHNHGVGPGDLFLFFGLFRQTVFDAGQLRWERAAPRVHAMFGFLEIGDVVPVSSAEDASRLPWAADHPHICVWQRPGNTLYVGAAASALAPGQPGAGLLTFSDATRLTRPGATTSVWHLPTAFAAHRGQLTYHTRYSRWVSEPDGTVTLTTVGRGQEFIVDADDSLRRWASGLISQNYASTQPAPTARR